MSNENSGVVRNLVQAETVHGGIHHHYDSSGPSRPRQLPPEPAIFVDREQERATLDALLARDGTRGRARFIVISGLSGAGKSALAARWVRSVSSRFEDGQIYVDLHARDRTVGVAEIARRCLRALGVREDDLPATEEEALALLRSWTEERKVIVVVDDATDPGLLLRLLPASADSVVLVTSPRSARELTRDGVEPIELRTMTEPAALDLLAGPSDAERERVEADPEAARNIVELCGGLPVALRIVAGRLAQRPNLSLARVAGELADADRRLERLAERGERVVRNSLDVAVGYLTERQRSLYRVLGIVPGPTFSVELAAVLAAVDEYDAEELLVELHAVNLLEVDDQQQYRFHDLVRLHARALTRDLAPSERERALHRLVEWYRRWGAFADRKVMEPSRLRVGGDEDLVEGRENPFDGTSALEWLERELPNILALVHASAEREDHRTVLSLCDGPLWALHNQHKHYEDTLRALEAAVVAAQAEHDLVAEARMRTLRVRLMMECHEFDSAHEQARAALRVAERSGHRRVLASACEFHGRVYLEQEHWSEAVELFRRAHGINEELSKPRGMALQEYFLGLAHSGSGDHEQALRSLNTALDRLTDFPDDRRTPNRVRAGMARVYQRLHRHEDAIGVLRVVEVDLRRRQVSFDLAEPLELLAVSLRRTGADQHARECLAEALDIYERSGSPRAERLRREGE